MKQQRKPDEGEEDMPADGLRHGAQASEESEYDFCALVLRPVCLTWEFC